MQKIVITGALGHIGSRLIRALPDRFPGMQIVLVDNLATQRYCSLFGLPDTAQYSFRELDVIDADLAPIMDGADAVVHLAALTDAAGSFDKRDLVEQVNFEATKQVAEACVECNVPLIHLSSTSVYGTQKDIVSEDCSDEDLQPQSPYAETKLREENLVRQIGEASGLKFVSCRFGTIFGTSPGMRFHTAVNKFCWQAAMGLPLTVWKTAYDQQRPYLDLSDAVKAVALILENGIFDGEVYNVLTLNAAVRDIVEAIRGRVQTLNVEFVESRIMNQLSYIVSSEKFNAHGFCPTGDLNKGVAETIDLLHQANAQGDIL